MKSARFRKIQFREDTPTCDLEILIYDLVEEVDFPQLKEILTEKILSGRSKFSKNENILVKILILFLANFGFKFEMITYFLAHQISARSVGKIFNSFSLLGAEFTNIEFYFIDEQFKTYKQDYTISAKAVKRFYSRGTSSELIKYLNDMYKKQFVIFDTSLQKEVSLESFMEQNQIKIESIKKLRKVRIEPMRKSSPVGRCKVVKKKVP